MALWYATVIDTTQVWVMFIPCYILWYKMFPESMKEWGELHILMLLNKDKAGLIFISLQNCNFVNIINSIGYWIVDKIKTQYNIKS